MRKIIFGMVHTKQSKSYTPHAVESFLKHTKISNLKLFLIDNDKDIKSILPNVSKINEINLIERDSPHSFSQNANQLAKLALDEKADLFFLNNDIIFTKDWVSPFFSNSFSVQIPASNNQYQYMLSDLKLEFSMSLDQYLGKEQVFSQIADKHTERKFGLIQQHTIPYYCVHIPYQVLKIVGLFDERYSPYGWEDTDYTVRAYKEGIPLFVNSNSFILHFYGKSTWNKDGSNITQEDKHCAKLFIEKWGNKIADLFGYQTKEALAYLNCFKDQDLRKTLRDFIIRAG